MELLFITTETIHHYHFLKQIVSRYEELKVETVLEQTQTDYRYATKHQLDTLANKYEKETWGYTEIDFTKVSNKLTRLNNINDLESWCKVLSNSKYTMIVTYGVSKINFDVINILRRHSDCIYNFHGGYLEEYRGLDTNLWALWHKQYTMLAASIHELEPKLDSGRVILSGPLDYVDLKQLPVRLRASSTDKFIQLFSELINKYPDHKKNSHLPSKLGRYYSSMPSVLKNDLLNWFPT